MDTFYRFVQRVIAGALDLVFPRQCIGCSREGISLCLECRESLPEALWDTGEVKDMYALFDYQDTVVKKMIWHIKYKGNRELAGIGGEMLYEKIIEFLGDKIQFGEMKNPLLIPTPISKKRLRERGFNQAARLVKEILRRDEERFFEADMSALRKIKHTAPQTSLGERSERLQNIKGCFFVASPEKIAKRNIIIIDDVYTTGGTILEMRRVLKEAGAKNAIAFTIAH